MDTLTPQGTGIDRMRIVGGNLALDFVNTRTGPPGGPPDDDLLATYDDLAAWGRHLGSISEIEWHRLRRQGQRDPAAAQAALERALRLRDDLDGVFRAIAAGTQPATKSILALRSAEAVTLARASLVADDGAYTWSWATDRSLERPFGPVIHAAIELLTAGPLDRVKACGRCQFLFVDESKNRSRRWCSMEDCGTAEKSRRFVARRAGRPVD